MSEPYEFVVGGRRYKASPMDARAQWHVARRIQPLLVSIIPGIKTVLPAIKAALPDGKMEPGALLALDMDKIDFGEITAAIKAPSDLLAQMDDDVLDYIEAKCLARVQREKPGGAGWASIYSAQADRMLFDDIPSPEVRAIMLKVLVAETGPFFLELVSSFSQADQP